MNTEEEFWDAFIPEPITGCLLWTGSRRGPGYGQVCWRGKQGSVHRLVWTLKRGPIPEGLHVLHKCDTRTCGNIDHLFLGTQSDNNKDAGQKGRTARGERHHNAKLTADQVRAIRESKLSSNEIAPQFGINARTLRGIRSGVAWRHVQ